MTLQEFIEKLEAEQKATRALANEWFSKAQANPNYWQREAELNTRANTLMDVLFMALSIDNEPTAQPVATEAPRIAPAQPCACGSGVVLVCDDNNRCAKCNGLAF